MCDAHGRRIIRQICLKKIKSIKNLISPQFLGFKWQLLSVIRFQNSGKEVDI